MLKEIFDKVGRGETLTAKEKRYIRRFCKSAGIEFTNSGCANCYADKVVEIYHNMTDEQVADMEMQITDSAPQETDKYILRPRFARGFRIYNCRYAGYWNEWTLNDTVAKWMYENGYRWLFV